MKTTHTDPRNGSVLGTVVMYTAIASITVGSILTAVVHYMKYNRFSYEHERAFYLAEAGLGAAIAELRTGGDGIVTMNSSTQFFANASYFVGTNWGFRTSVTDIGSNRVRVASIGVQQGSTATVTSDIEDLVGLSYVHALYSLAIYAGNSSGDTNYSLGVGGTGTGADYVNGDVHVNGDIELSGDAVLRYPEAFTDANGNGIYDIGEDFDESGTLVTFTNAISAADLAAYQATLNADELYLDNKYNDGEGFVDTIGNGIYDTGEAFTDSDTNGVYTFGDSYTDANSNGTFDAGESYVDRGNGSYDAGEVFVDDNLNGVWDPGESYEDLGNGSYNPGESYEDRNGTFDEGEAFVDDRNGLYDYGTTATGDVTGMGTPGTGQDAATGSDDTIDPPNLTNMYYALPKSATEPSDAYEGWGHDIDVASGSFDADGKITTSSDPRHVFVKNPTDRTYTKIGTKDDYFFEDPTDASYGGGAQFITLSSNGNDKVYFVDGNLYIHNPNAMDFMFRDAGSRITIIANGNITISDEFRYNGGTSNPLDSMALIALKDPGTTDSGNIYLGDAQFGTGGEVHSMLYAENDFIDNNLDTTGQPYLSVFGNMSAGNQVAINRGTGSGRTRLDVTLDERIRSMSDTPPGLPHAQTGQRTLSPTSSNDWQMVSGSWSSHSQL